MAKKQFLVKILLWGVVFWERSFADQTVYLERPANPAVYVPIPWFNPSTIRASVGENIHFVARFGNQRPYHPAVQFVDGENLY